MTSPTNSEARPGARSRAIVVLGAGRSGTSAITRALSALGVELGDRLRPGRGKNPTGFFEDLDLLALNKRLRRILGLEADSVRLIEDAEWRQPSVAALREEAIATIRRRFGSQPLWGYKYGRTLRLLPFWEDVYRALDLDVAYVVAVRNPLSVARSRAQLDSSRGSQEKSDLEWLANVVPYFLLATQRTLVVVDYDRVVDEPPRELERIAAALSLPLTPAVHAGIQAYATDFVRSDRRHTVFSVHDFDGRIHPLVRDAYCWLDRLARDDVDVASSELRDGWTRIETEVHALAPLLAHVDRVEGRLRRAQSSPLGPLQAVPRLWRYLKSR